MTYWYASQFDNRSRSTQSMRAALLALAALLACATAADEKKIVCYFGSWAVYRPGNGQIDISDIDPKLCTHLIYTFVGINPSGGIEILDPWADLPNGGGRDGFNRFNQLRGKSPGTKTLIAIGGWNEGSVNYSKVAGNPTIRKTFVENAVAFVRKYGFDGFDFDWEYPNQRGGAKEDRENYVLLLKELRERFDQEGLILSAAVGAAPPSASQSYIVPEVVKYLHFVNLMAYDMHGVWDKKTGLNAPLYAGSWEKDDERLLNVNASINYWLSQGATPEKLILGMPLYGRAFTLDSAATKGIGAAASQPGNAGPYTREAGSLGYNEICEMQLTEDWEVIYEPEQRVPYAVKGDQWVGYENPSSIKEKAEFINKLGLGGAMVWSVETDDFQGICGNKYPLLTVLNHVLRGGPALPPPPIKPSTTTTTESEGSSKVVCTEPGYLRDPEDCSVFYMCVADDEVGFKKQRFVCPDGLVFDLELNICNWPDQVDCSTPTQ